MKPSRLLPVVVAALLAACAVFRGTPGPARITGRVFADRLPADSRIEVYRNDGEGPAVPVVGNVARPDDTGRFATAPVTPGRYVLVLRTREAPPSTATAVVPDRTEVEIRLASPGGGSTVVLESPASAPSARTVRILPDETRGELPDRREVVLLPGQEARIAGLAPGLWHFDVLPDGATADFVVPSGEAVHRFVIDPPEFPATGGVLEGAVQAPRDRSAFGTAVTARVCGADGFDIRPWGRLALVERDGRFRLDRLPTGPAFVRVERREATFTWLPTPELIVISPSEPVWRGYRVEP